VHEDRALENYFLLDDGEVDYLFAVMKWVVRRQKLPLTKDTSDREGRHYRGAFLHKSHDVGNENGMFSGIMVG